MRFKITCRGCSMCSGVSEEIVYLPVPIEKVLRLLEWWKLHHSPGVTMEEIK
jgi:hypothetical protein